jgi:hypothetical protein
MAIRNVAVQKADPNKKVGYGITNINTTRRTANDNSRTPTRAKLTPPPAAGNDNRRPVSFADQTQKVTAKVTAVANATSATWFIMGLTWILYLIQLVFSVMALVGLGAVIAVEETIVNSVDFFGLLSGTGEIFFYVGMGMTLLVGVMTFLIAVMVFMFRGVVMARSASTLVAAVCFALYLFPGFSLVPWAWLWCFYVVKTQVSQ